MKKLLLAPALMLAMSSAKAQLALENFNGTGLPAGWTTFNDANNPDPTLFTASGVTALKAAGWIQDNRATGDKMMLTTSIFSPVGISDRWLVSPAFNVTSADMYINWEAVELTRRTGKNDLIEVWVSTTGGATKADFTTKLTSFAPDVTAWTFGRTSLGAFNGMNIKVAFRNVGNDAGVPGLDNVQTTIIAPFTDLALTSVSPAAGSSGTFAAVGAGVPISGNVKNNGTTNITSYTVNYKVGTAAVITETKTPATPIAPLGTASFSFTPTVTATAATQDVKIWITAGSDVIYTNDTMKTTVTGYTKKPVKKMLAEEGTGTWCQWCPRGAIYMDSAYHKYPNNFSFVAVHNSSSDPMQVPTYDAYVSSKVSGYPSLLVDRNLNGDPSQIFDYYTAAKDNFGLADIAVSKTNTGLAYTFKATVTPAINTSGDYRLALVLTEDRVSGTAAGYAQKNAYAGGGAGPMGNAEFNFATLPSTVPAATMKYDFVARGIYPSPTGAAGSLPATMVSGTAYNYTFPAVTIPATWNVLKMKAIVMLISNADGKVLNTQNIPLANVSIAEKFSGVNSVDVYPNPATSVVNIHFNLAEQQSNFTIEIVDMMGKVVKTINKKMLAAGTYEIPTSTAELASGMYLVKISTDNGSVTERLSVVK